MERDGLRIPGYSKYRITKNGDVFSSVTDKWLAGSINPAGYCHYRLIDDAGVIKTIARHRLLCMTFKPIPCNPLGEGLIVNHINGVKGCDQLDNLEWLSCRENVHHAGALGLTEKCIPIQCRDLSTGVIHTFPSALACASFFNMTADSVLFRLKNKLGSQRIFPEKRQYRKLFGDGQQPWFTPPDIEKSISMGLWQKTVVLKHFLSGIEQKFASITSAGNFLNISISSMTQRLTEDNAGVVWPDGYQIKYDDGSEWKAARPPKGSRHVLVCEKSTGKKYIFNSPSACAKKFNILTTTLIWRLKKGVGYYFSPGFSFSYTSPFDPKWSNESPLIDGDTLKLPPPTIPE